VLHAQLLRHGLLFAPPPHAVTVLLHFYAATGRLPSACHLFDEMPFRDMVSHNTMMMAYPAAEVCPVAALMPLANCSTECSSAM
jgi:pentatricopeptide repeat protein